jgi:hypothetical protein
MKLPRDGNSFLFDWIDKFNFRLFLRVFMFVTPPTLLPFRSRTNFAHDKPTSNKLHHHDVSQVHDPRRVRAGRRVRPRRRGAQDYPQGATSDAIESHPSHKRVEKHNDDL